MIGSKRWLVLAGTGLALAATPLLAGEYYTSVLVMAAIFAIMTTGLNLFMGYTGQISFGHNAFAAVGAYAAAILTTRYGWPPIGAMLAAIATAATLGLLTGYPTLRLRGHYLAIATFALGVITVQVATNWKAFTLGTFGIPAIPPLSLLGVQLTSEYAYFYVYWGIAALGICLAWRLRHSRFGRALCAIGGDEHAAAAVGIDVARYKLAAFIVSASYAGLAGSLFAFYVTYISPDAFNVYMVTLVFTMLFLGGVGTIYGPVIGAVLVTLLPEALRVVDEAREIIYALVILLILLFAPRGVAGIVDALRQREAKPLE